MGATFVRTAWCGFAALFALIGMTIGAAALERRCARASAVAGAEKAMPQLIEKVAARSKIRIVALGSSSTEGTPDMPQADIYPAVLERTLSAEVSVPVELVNKGKGGETIRQMVARLDRDVLALRPDLLVWQLGVNDVLALDGVSEAISEMRKALATLKRRGVPVVLVDLQVAPMVDSDKDTPAMQQAIAEAAEAEDVMHFQRYGVMKSLIASKEASLPELVQGDGLHMTKLGHFCTGSLLAKQIAGASRLRRRLQAAAPTTEF